LAEWRNYFCQLLNVHGDNYVRQTEIYTVGSSVPDLNAFEFEIVTGKLKGRKLSGINQIPVELLKMKGKTFIS
jgi:hypothetical protein